VLVVTAVAEAAVQVQVVFGQGIDDTLGRRAVMRAALAHQVLLVGALSVQRVRCDHRSARSMRSSRVENIGISFVLASTLAWSRTTPHS
jgi:hypothetical protein